ncbi:hypothetical protein PRUPE_3G137900 [Prunus persica]|uniref:Uncharacterized protein n=1 Tax=Prunus persica TaxID=3760 RepID=A0A251PZV5_PRUPE|nr:hypothetical protein PRUPE_3G137900 [Prunus persica]
MYWLYEPALIIPSSAIWPDHSPLQYGKSRAQARQITRNAKRKTLILAPSHATSLSGPKPRECLGLVEQVVVWRVTSIHETH